MRLSLRHRAAFLMAMSLMLVSPVLCADEPTPQQVFDSIYGQMLLKAAGTISKADDLEAAEDLLEGAEMSRSQKALASLCCQRAYQLASGTPQGYETAMKALLLLEQVDASKRDWVIEHSVELRQRLFGMARGTEKNEARDDLVAALRRWGDLQLRRRKHDEALEIYRRALLVNRDEVQEIEIKKQVDQIEQVQAAQKRIEELKQKLEKNKNDYLTRQQLVEAYVVDANDPNAASKYLNYTIPNLVQKNVHMAKRKAKHLSAEDNHTLGGWYRGFSKSSEGIAKVNILLRAKEYYETYLTKDTKESLQRIQAKLELKAINEELAALEPVIEEKPAPPEPSKEGLVWLWQFNKGANQAQVPGQQAAKCGVQAQGKAEIDTTESMALKGGRFTASGFGPATINAMRQANAFTLAMLITPSEASQSGPATIAAISRSRGGRRGGGMLVQDIVFCQEKQNLGVIIRIQTQRGSIPQATQLTATRANAPMHVALTVEKNKLTFYVNGKSSKTMTLNGTIQGWDMGCRLGFGAESNQSRPWKGQIRNVRIYNKAYEASEIKKMSDYAQWQLTEAKKKAALSK